MSILSFLSYWSGRVREWFGWLYDSGRNAAIYAYSWAESAGRRYYNLAVNYISYQVNSLRSSTLNWIWEKYNLAVGYANGIRDYLVGLFNSIYGWVESRLIQVQNWVMPYVNTFRDWANGQLIAIRSWALSKITELRNFIDAISITWYEFVNSKIQDIENKLTAKFGWILEKNSSGESTLYTFLSNPLGFIMAYIWSIFEDLLCYGLAYGLGSTKYELPPVPVWSSPGITGGFLTPSTSSPGASGLLSPLKSLSVSGYRFTPGHRATDYGLQNGDPVYAMHDGEVLLTNVSGSGYGVQVVIAGGDWWSRYAHFQNLAVRVGDRVHAGQVLGQGDSTGNSTGPHLHLEIKYKGEFINPETVL